jgi:hypothetical protein
MPRTTKVIEHCEWTVLIAPMSTGFVTCDSPITLGRLRVSSRSSSIAESDLASQAA